MTVRGLDLYSVPFSVFIFCILENRKHCKFRKLFMYCFDLQRKTVFGNFLKIGMFLKIPWKKFQKMICQTNFYFQKQDFLSQTN